MYKIIYIIISIIYYIKRLVYNLLKGNIIKNLLQNESDLTKLRINFT